MRSSLLLLSAGAMLATTLIACAQTPPPPRTVQSFDPALVRERQRRMAAYDSVVRSVNTDSLYRLWQATLTAPDVRVALLLVQCELGRLSYRYGHAAYDATKRMQDTLWKHADPAAVKRMDHRMAERGSIPIGSSTCGPPPPVRAPRWLREWWAYELPKLPPSPDDTTTSDPWRVYREVGRGPTAVHMRPSSRSRASQCAELRSIGGTDGRADFANGASPSQSSSPRSALRAGRGTRATRSQAAW